MKDFLIRVLIGLTTGYILCYYGELMFWATPEREGMTVGGIIGTWLVYSCMAYVFLCVVSVFNVRSVWAVYLAGAFYGWYEEGIIVQTMYGTPDGPFPLSISFTGLAWHASIDVFIGWYLVRKVLAREKAIQNISLAGVIGLFYGFWGIFWWNEPPEAMKALLDMGQKDILLIRFGFFVLATTAVLILAHWLYNRVIPFVFKPSKLELWFLGAATLLYYACITVPAAPKALWVLPPLMVCTFWALNKNRHLESRPDAISAFDTKVKPLNYFSLFVIPLIATTIYFLGLAADAKLRVNIVVYYVSSVLGVLMWIASIVVIVKKTGRHAGKKAEPAGAGDALQRA
jgi:hypothetical protein